MKSSTIWLLLGAAACAAATDSFDAPSIMAGDTLTYRNTADKTAAGWSQSREDITVSRVTDSSIHYTTRATGSSQPPKESYAGLDWSRIRDVGGRETVVNRPLSFPLAVGKTWNVGYTEPRPNKMHRSETLATKFTVVGYETLEVPAGTFKALKIEAEGHWTAEIEPGQNVVQGAQSSAEGVSMTTQVQRMSERSATGRTYKAFWYAPEVKRWVKSVEEYYGSGGVRNESYTTELESFKVG